MQVENPFRINANGRSATTSPNEHIRDLIEQVLFTRPGERVNRPTFGSDLMRLVFAPNSDELATATHFLVQGALQQWLSDYIRVEEVKVVSEGSTLRVSVQYVVLQSQERRTAEFSREV